MSQDSSVNEVTGCMLDNQGLIPAQFLKGTRVYCVM
jgi:hypothetical protein